MLTTMSKAEVRSRAKARRAASMAGKFNKTDAKFDKACCHSGIHMNRRELRSHESCCHDNPMNMKQPANTDRPHG